MVARYLGQAQEMIEQELLYPIGQKWFVNEQHKNVHRFFTTWARVRALGVRAVSVIASGVALDHTTDPATIPAVATTVTDEDEIHFYISGTDDEVYPDTLTLSGGFINATFPRARLVTAENQDNPDTGLTYGDTGPTGPFAQELDVKRVIRTRATSAYSYGRCESRTARNATKRPGRPAAISDPLSGVVTLLPDPTGNCFIAALNTSA
jgi:hypothetical protein